MQHYRFKLLFLAMLCCSGHAFGQAPEWLADGGNCSNQYYGYSAYAECGTYGASNYGFYSVDAYALTSCGVTMYVLANATVYHYGGVYPDQVIANSELAYNGTNPGIDVGFVAFWGADGDGYNYGEFIEYCFEVGGYGGP